MSSFVGRPEQLGAPRRLARPESPPVYMQRLKCGPTWDYQGTFSEAMATNWCGRFAWRQDLQVVRAWHDSRDCLVRVCSVPCIDPSGIPQGKRRTLRKGQLNAFIGEGMVPSLGSCHDACPRDPGAVHGYRGTGRREGFSRSPDYLS